MSGSSFIFDLHAQLQAPHGVRRTQPPKFQGQEYSEGSTAPPHTTSYYSTSTGTIYWKAVSSNPIASSQPSPTSLPKLKHKALALGGYNQQVALSQKQGKEGHNLVYSMDARLEWQKDAGPNTKNCDQDQCIPERLGSVPLCNIFRGMLVTG